MKRLTILRHAKSSWSDSSVDDHDRPLNDRGWKASRRIGREMQQRGLRFDHVLASTATRVRETLEGVKEEFVLDANIRFDIAAYLASGQKLVELVRELPDSVEAALLVGHNPGLQQLVLALTRGGVLHDRVAAKYPTGALAIIGLPAESWTELKPGSGELAELILPLELD